MENTHHLPDQVQGLSELLLQAPCAVLGQLTSPAKALVALTKAIETQGSVLILTRESEDGALEADLSFLASTLYPTQNVLVESFPSWEVLPFEKGSASADIVGSRFKKLAALKAHQGPSVILVTLGAFLQKVVPPEALDKLMLPLAAGQTVDFETLVDLLREDMGYQERSLVSDKGEFAVRGGIIDIFPTNEKTPYRLDFFGDTLELIKTFNPLTQQSVDKVKAITLMPALERLVLDKYSQSLTTLSSYMQGATHLVINDMVQIEEAYIALMDAKKQDSPLMLSLPEALEPFNRKLIFFSEESLAAHFPGFNKAVRQASDQVPILPLELCNLSWQVTPIELPLAGLPLLDIETDSVLAKLTALSHLNFSQLYFVTATEAEKVHLDKALSQLQFAPSCQLHFLEGLFSHSLIFRASGIAIISYAELTEKEMVKRETWRQSYHTPASTFHQLEKGDLVVHLQSGIAKFMGFEKQKNHLHKHEEFMILEYAEGSKLFVPLSQSHLVSRYIGTQTEVPPLTKLGSKKWTQAKVKAQKAVVGYAKELLDLEAKRRAIGGFIYEPDSEEMRLFEEDFPYEPTVDQKQAILDIKADMLGAEAMDRLICGDVGYGKTEVAMRTAFKAVVDGGKQVAVMVPTTVLASQHYDSFVSRMKDFPVRIALLCRMNSKKQTEETLKGLKEGTIDIVIGTHRLASKDVGFKNLGVLIIDEEQRFGVRTKEHLKKLKTGIDCLTLSATPIPRTLYSSLINLKAMSQISTPPQDRLPIKTVIAETDDKVIEAALLRELARGGKAFFIHNRVESIYEKKAWLEKLVPHAKMAVGHGQMTPSALDDIFHDFKHGDLDILLATTIVENGVDIPKANTIFIDKANTYGMADLYQLRGRVGRWKRLAYAYFLVPKNKELSEESRARLNALVETSGFGGGMKLAMRDLEIRGAGDILGVKQSGMVASVGFHFYCKMLKKTIAELKKKTGNTDIETIPSIYEVKVDSEFPSNFSHSYISHSDLRLEIYHRIGDIEKEEDLIAIEEELVDRFGPLPAQDKWFFAMANLRLFAALNKLTYVKMGKEQLLLHFMRRKKPTQQRVPMPLVDKPEEYIQIAKELIKRVLSQPT